MSRSRVEAIANAVLYEGYALYPYRPGSVKNRRRFNFGLLAPKAVVERADQGYCWSTRTECLVQGGDRTLLSVTVRFLQLRPQSAFGDAGGQPLSEEWHEATERVVQLADLGVADLAAGGKAIRTPFGFDGLDGHTELSAESLPHGGFRLRILIANLTSPGAGAVSAHNDILPLAFLSTHSILSVAAGEFISLLEPPDEWREAAAGCTNTGVYPVLVGEAGRRDVMLSSPIILYDYPEVAAESPGDLFDGAEIDEILTLRILTLTDDEKVAMRHTDDRTRRLLERTEALTPAHIMKLHAVMHGRQVDERER